MTGEAGGSRPSRSAERQPARPEAKLFAVVRAPLAKEDPGLAAAQLGHAIGAWVLEHGAPPENLILLEAPDPEALLAQVPDGCRRIAFREPDLDDQLTAVALGPMAWRTVSNLPLFLRGLRRPR